MSDNSEAEKGKSSNGIAKAGQQRDGGKKNDEKMRPRVGAMLDCLIDGMSLQITCRDGAFNHDFVIINSRCNELKHQSNWKVRART